MPLRAPHAADDAPQVVLARRRLAERAAVDRRQRLRDARRRVLLAHLQAQDQSPDPVVLGLAQLALRELPRRHPRHRRLPAAGLAGEDEDLGRLEALHEVVEELQSEVSADLDAGRLRRHQPALLLDEAAPQVLEADELLREQRRRRDLHGVVRRLRGDLIGRLQFAVNGAGDGGGELEQRAVVGVALDELGVVDRLAGVGGLSGGEALHLANGLALVDLPRPRQRLGAQLADRQRVDRFVGVVGADDLVVERAERRGVEVPGFEQRADDLAGDARAREQLPDDRRFGLGAVGRLDRGERHVSPATGRSAGRPPGRAPPRIRAPAATSVASLLAACACALPGYSHAVSTQRLADASFA